MIINTSVVCQYNVYILFDIVLFTVHLQLYIVKILENICNLSVLSFSENQNQLFFCVRYYPLDSMKIGESTKYDGFLFFFNNFSDSLHVIYIYYFLLC